MNEQEHKHRHVYYCPVGEHGWTLWSDVEQLIQNRCEDKVCGNHIKDGICEVCGNEPMTWKQTRPLVAFMGDNCHKIMSEMESGKYRTFEKL